MIARLFESDEEVRTSSVLDGRAFASLVESIGSVGVERSGNPSQAVSSPDASCGGAKPTATVAVLVAASAAAASTAERSFRLDSHRRSGASISGSEPRSSLLWREMCCGAPLSLASSAAEAAPEEAEAAEQA